MSRLRYREPKLPDLDVDGTGEPLLFGVSVLAGDRRRRVFKTQKGSRRRKTKEGVATARTSAGKEGTPSRRTIL